MDFLEKKIIEILGRPISAPEAADQALAFISELPDGANALAQFAMLGEEGLLHFFGTRPGLKPACANMSRLVEFIRAFLKMYAEDQAEAANAAKDAAAKNVPLQN